MGGENGPKSKVYPPKRPAKAGPRSNVGAGNACRRESPCPPNSSLESSQLSSMSPELPGTPRANLVRRAEDWRWSSLYRWHCGSIRAVFRPKTGASAAEEPRIVTATALLARSCGKSSFVPKLGLFVLVVLAILRIMKERSHGRNAPAVRAEKRCLSPFPRFPLFLL